MMTTVDPIAEMPTASAELEPMLAGLMAATLDRRSDLLAVKDVQSSRMVHANEAMAAFLRRPMAEVLGRTDVQLFEPVLAGALRAADQTALAQGEPLVSDHRFEQRGLLHVPVHWNGLTVHAVVVHFGLAHRSRLRQVERLARFIADAVPAGERLVVAGDFNDWGERLDAPMAELGLTRAADPRARRQDCVTFPSLAPVFALDRFYLRGLTCRSTLVPRGVSWARMSDHLPLVAELHAV